MSCALRSTGSYIHIWYTVDPVIYIIIINYGKIPHFLLCSLLLFSLLGKISFVFGKHGF